MTAAQLQLELPLDPLRNQLTAPEIAAAEAVIEDQAVQLAAHGRPARRCRCTRPWGEPQDRHCVRCGRQVTATERGTLAPDGARVETTREGTR